MTAIKVPSGKQYNWPVTAANRPQAVNGGVTAYATVTSFTAGGDASGISYGSSGMTETVGRNARGQVTSILAQLGATTLLSLTNEFDASTNNGNLKSQTVSPLGMTQLYSLKFVF